MASLTTTTITALRATMRKLFDDGMRTAQTQHAEVASMMPSGSRKTVYAWLNSFPHLSESTAGTSRSDGATKANDYDLENKLYRNNLPIDLSDIEDDNLGLYGDLMRSMGAEAMIHVDRENFKLLKDGRANDCFDGKKFFAEDHPVYPNNDGTGVVVPTPNIVNPGTTNQTEWYLLACGVRPYPLIWQPRTQPRLQALDNIDDERVYDRDQIRYGTRVRRGFGYGHWRQAVSCRDELNHENFNKAYEMLTSFKWDGGNPAGFIPTHMVVPPSLRAKALAVGQSQVIFESQVVQNQAGDENVGGMGAAVTNINQGVVKVLWTPYLL